jgi:hypothetical protein
LLLAEVLEGSLPLETEALAAEVLAGMSPHLLVAFLGGHLFLLLWAREGLQGRPAPMQLGIRAVTVFLAAQRVSAAAAVLAHRAALAVMAALAAAGRGLAVVWLRVPVLPVKEIPVEHLLEDFPLSALPVAEALALSEAPKPAQMVALAARVLRG